MRFEFPWAFLTLLLVPPIVYLRLRKHAFFSSIQFSTTKTAVQIRPSLRQRLVLAPLALRIAALILIATALARPQVGRERVRDVTEGIAIMMVVDRSGSMAAEMQYDNKPLNRLTVVKRVFEEFVLGNKRGLPGRPDDLIGMVSFARYADTTCPLTLSHGALNRFLETINLVEKSSEDGTSIGDALALAAARLETAEESVDRHGDVRQNDVRENEYHIRSKIIILLTDGQNNFGKRTPAEAAAVAAKWGIKVYAIGIGGREDFVTVNTPFGPRKLPAGSDIDEATLAAIAEETGGIYRRAGDAQALREVYQEIDTLEKSEIQSIQYQDYREVFLPFALAALALLVLEIGLSCTVLRRTP